MLIEAISNPIRYQWPQGEIYLEPGYPKEVNEKRGRKVLAKCGGKVRVAYQPGQMVSYQTPVDGCIKKGGVELIDESWMFKKKRRNTWDSSHKLRRSVLD